MPRAWIEICAHSVVAHAPGAADEPSTILDCGDLYEITVSRLNGVWVLLAVDGSSFGWTMPAFFTLYQTFALELYGDCLRRRELSPTRFLRASLAAAR